MKKIIVILVLLFTALLLVGCDLLDAYSQMQRENENRLVFEEYNSYLLEIELVVPEGEPAYVEIQGRKYAIILNAELLWRPTEDEMEAVGVGNDEMYGASLYYTTSSPLCIFNEGIYRLIPGVALSQSYYFDASVDRSYFTEIDFITELAFVQYNENSDGTFNYSQIDYEKAVDDKDTIDEFITLAKGEPAITDDNNHTDEYTFHYFGVVKTGSSDEVYEGLDAPGFAVYTEVSHPGSYFIDANKMTNTRNTYIDVTDFLEKFLP